MRARRNTIHRLSVVAVTNSPMTDHEAAALLAEGLRVDASILTGSFDRFPHVGELVHVIDGMKRQGSIKLTPTREVEALRQLDTASELKRKGYEINKTSYPWKATKGGEVRLCLTDTEEMLLSFYF